MSLHMLSGTKVLATYVGTYADKTYPTTYVGTYVESYVVITDICCVTEPKATHVWFPQHKGTQQHMSA